MGTPIIWLFSTFRWDNSKNFMRFVIYIEIPTSWAQPHLCSSNSLLMASKRTKAFTFEISRKNELSFPSYLQLLLYYLITFLYYNLKKFISIEKIFSMSFIWAQPEVSSFFRLEVTLSQSQKLILVGLRRIARKVLLFFYLPFLNYLSYRDAVALNL